MPGGAAGRGGFALTASAAPMGQPKLSCLMKILLLNDNGVVPHIGCLGVSDAHARMLGSRGHAVVRRRFVADCGDFYTGDEEASTAAVLADPGLRSDLDSVDAVVLNGEGSIHHGAGLHWLAIVAAAQRLGKMTLVVNAVVQESLQFVGVLRSADDVCVRDLRSLRYLESQGVRARLVPDSIFEANFDGGCNIDLTGRIVVTDWHPQRNADVGAAIRGFMQERGTECFYYPMMHGCWRDHWRSALADWLRARAVVTGRHHGVCLAALARVPFVALPSNTYKVEGMLEAAGSDLGTCTDAAGISRTLERLEASIEPCRRVWEYVDSMRPLTTFRVLGQGTGPTGAAGAEAEVARLQRDAVAPEWTRNPLWWEFGLAPNLRP